MMNRGILNPTLYPTIEPTGDYFEALIEPLYNGEKYVIIPPLLGLAFSDLLPILPAININFYVDGELKTTVELAEKENTPANFEDRINSLETLGAYVMFDEPGNHLIKIEPMSDSAGRARAIGYSALSGTDLHIALTLLRQPSNKGYYISEGNPGGYFKALQYSNMIIRNSIEVEDIQIVRALSYYFQFKDAECPEVTLIAKDTSESERRFHLFYNSNIQRINILGNVMDNTTNYRSDLKGLNPIPEIYVDSALVDSYKALDADIAPHVHSLTI